MYWNYRVLQLNNKENKPYFEVHEVYYDENDVPYNWAESHNVLVGDTLDELKESYEYMASAFEMPLLKVVENNNLEEVKE